MLIHLRLLVDPSPHGPLRESGSFDLDADPRRLTRDAVFLRNRFGLNVKVPARR